MWRKTGIIFIVRSVPFFRQPEKEYTWAGSGHPEKHWLSPWKRTGKSLCADSVRRDPIRVPAADLTG